MPVVTCESIRLLLDPPGTPISILLHRRALPNARLIRAFGIRNSTFTNPSTNVRLTFRKHAMTRLRNLDTLETWQMLAGAIKRVVDFYLSEDPMGDYATYMQTVVFVTVLAAFFNHDIPFPEAADVQFVTEGINTLWTASKSPTFSPTSPVLVRIKQSLHAWVPDNPADPFGQNPLEILLPAYETLWRLVAHAFTYIEGSPEYSQPFLDFLDKPTAMHFKKPGPLGTPSAQHFMQEVLRLHPPTKRIKRVQDRVSTIPSWIRRRLFTAVGFNCVSVSCSNIVAADIEALQRSSVWGPSPHEFDPLRHRATTEAQRESFMPFGVGPLKCVASSVAPRLAGLIVGGMVERGDIELIRGGSQGGREGWEGWKIIRRL